MKNAEKIPRRSRDLIPRNKQSRQKPKEPQQLGSEIFSEFNLYLNINFSPGMVNFGIAILLETCKPVNTRSQFIYKSGWLVM